MFKFTVKRWLTKTDKPVPMRTMKGTILRETAKAIHVRLEGFLEPSKVCLHCGRKLTHKVSLLYGIGPICGQHFHINPLASEEELEKHYDRMKAQMERVQWEGWLPKSQVKIEN
jgi:hypothetical protein